MGFIGGGAILKHGVSVYVTATAASLWATGAIGVAVGLASYEIAVTIAVLTFLTLKLLPLIKAKINLTRRRRLQRNARPSPTNDFYPFAPPGDPSSSSCSFFSTGLPGCSFSPETGRKGVCC